MAEAQGGFVSALEGEVAINVAALTYHERIESYGLAPHCLGCREPLRGADYQIDAGEIVCSKCGERHAVTATTSVQFT